MSLNRRITLNIIATCGWSLYALVCGLFVSRWVLAVAGKSEFGLYGVVGGMMVIELLACAVRRGCGGIAAVEMREGVDGMHSPGMDVGAGEIY